MENSLENRLKRVNEFYILILILLEVFSQGFVDFNKFNAKTSSKVVIVINAVKGKYFQCLMIVSD